MYDDDGRAHDDHGRADDHGAHFLVPLVMPATAASVAFSNEAAGGTEEGDETGEQQEGFHILFFDFEETLESG